MSRKTQNPEQYVGKIFRHTPKAIKDDCPADRLFFVVDFYHGPERSLKGFLVAWKVTVNETSRKFEHPGFKGWKPLKELKKDPTRFFQNKVARNGANPTALFPYDSYYKEVTNNFL